ncbi:MAG: gamma-glutamyl-gamma-aminobutyrate hydrolase family protein [Candidatus Kapabacteria bacterium]|nr:gamma-glutamyl-gamma-aminobutyrate hydrolase family protein [Candidatus Kapabacteria bacterium]
MKKLLFIIIGLYITLSGCHSAEKKLIIAFSKTADTSNYIKWIKKAAPEAICVNLYGKSFQQIDSILNLSNALVLTGGEDVHPYYFGKGSDTSICEINPYRDTLEFYLIKSATRQNLPIMAVCRGEQIFNVFNGGSLIIDIPRDKHSNTVHQCKDYKNCYHKIKIDESSQLYQICGNSVGSVNTNHHQAVDHLSEQLKPVAWSEDGIIEAYEWKYPNGKPLLIAVQWHPERLEENNPFGSNLAKFLLNNIIQKDLNKK